MSGCPSSTAPVASIRLSLTRSRASKAPAVVLVHDVIAMAPWVENVADRLAEAGYLAIAPDMLSGRSAEERQPLESGGKNIGPARRLPLEQVAADLNALADYAMKLPASNGKVCVVGFSWGGDQAFRFATTRRDLAAAFVFYGVCPEPENIPNIQAPSTVSTREPIRASAPPFRTPANA